MLDRFLPSLKRMAKFEFNIKNIIFIDRLWTKMKDKLMHRLELAGLPMFKRTFFPITRVLLAYLCNVYPQGSLWFTNLICFCSMYLCGMRTGNLLSLKWSFIKSYTVLPTEDPNVMIEEIECRFHNYKGWNKKLYQHFYLVGPSDVQANHPISQRTSPNVVVWLQFLLLEQTGLSIFQLMQEKDRVTDGSDTYRSIAHSYVFGTGKDQNLTNSNSDDVVLSRKRQVSISITLNSHLKEVMRSSGFSDDVIGSVALHNSLRRGAVKESEASFNNGTAQRSWRDPAFGWCPNSNTPRTVYDVSRESNNYFYSNTMFSMMDSPLPRSRDLALAKDELGLSHSSIISILRRSSDVSRCTFYEVPFAANVYFEDNYQIVSSVFAFHHSSFHDLTPTQKQQDMHHTIVLAVHKAYKYRQFPNVSRDFKESRQKFLALLTGHRRDEMGQLAYKIIVKYSDPTKTFQEKCNFHNIKDSHDDHDKLLCTDTQISKAIRLINNMSFNDIMINIDNIVDGNQFYGKAITACEMLAYILTGNCNDGSRIHRRAKYRQLKPKLLSFNSMDRFPKTKSKAFSDAMCLRIESNASPKSHLLIEEGEVITLLSTHQNFNKVYGWETLITMECPSIVSKGYDSQQVKDYVRNLRLRLTTTKEKGAVVARSQPLPLPVNPIVNNLSRRATVGQAYSRPRVTATSHPTTSTENNTDLSQDRLPANAKVFNTIVIRTPATIPNHVPNRNNSQLNDSRIIVHNNHSNNSDDSLVSSAHSESIESLDSLERAINNPTRVLVHSPSSESHLRPSSIIKRRSFHSYRDKKDNTVISSNPTFSDSEEEASVVVIPQPYATRGIQGLSQDHSKKEINSILFKTPAHSTNPHTTIASRKRSFLSDEDDTSSLDSSDESVSYHSNIIFDTVSSKRKRNTAQNVVGRKTRNVISRNESTPRLSLLEDVSSKRKRNTAEDVVGRMTRNVISRNESTPRLSLLEDVHSKTDHYATSISSVIPQNALQGDHFDPRIPKYTAGFTYQHSTLTYTANTHVGIANEYHGLLQPPQLGNGLHMDENYIYYTNFGQFNPAWIVELQGMGDGMCKTTTRNTGFCMACGYKLVNPLRPDERVKYYIVEPNHGHANQRNYVHYACSLSHLIRYNIVRFNACKCLFEPGSLEWAVSQNNDYHGQGQRWTYVEFIDLFVALKLSGEQLNIIKNWARVLRFAPILRLKGRTLGQLTNKYVQMQNVHAAYFTHVFNNVQFMFDEEHAPPPIMN